MTPATDSSTERPDAAGIARSVLMIAYHFPPSSATGARRPFRFVKYLARNSYRAHVIANQDQAEGSPWQHVTRVPGETVSWRARIGSGAAAALQRFLPYNDQLPWIAHAVEAAREVASRTRPEVVISTSPPAVCHLAAWIVSRQLRVPWVADFRDPIYGNPSRRRSWGWIWDAPLDRLIVSQAAALITNTDAAAEMLARRYPELSHKIHLIWNGYDPEQRLTAQPLPQREYKTIVHAGSLYGQRHPTRILASLHRLVSRGAVDPRQVRLRLVGDLYENEPWVTQSRFHELMRAGCVEHTGQVSPAEAAREMAESDYLLLLDLNDRGIGLQVPAKIFEYIQIGRPVLAFTGRNSPVQRILAGSGVRHICLHGSSPEDEVDRQLLALLDLPTAPVTSSPWFDEQFNGARQARTLAGILDSL